MNANVSTILVLATKRIPRHRIFLPATKEKCEEEIKRFLVSDTKYVWLMIRPHGLNSNFECHQEHVGGATTYLDRSAHLAQCRELF